MSNNCDSPASTPNVNLIAKSCSTQAEDLQTHEYKYYNSSGVYIGRSKGVNPEASLFTKAHYVICNDSQMIKNLDPISVVKRDIDRYRAELLTVPISHMEKIMELNHLIRNLEQFLDHPQESITK